MGGEDKRDPEEAELRSGAGCGVKMWEKKWGVLHGAGMAAETEMREGQVTGTV